MGCDVHGWIEADYFGKYKETKQESGYTAYYPYVDIRMLADRNYKLFGDLFGVRADDSSKKLFANRGLPPIEKFHEKDWRDINSKDWKADGHSHTYVYWNELKPHLSQIAVSEGWQIIFEIMESIAKVRGDKNVRLVCWFDN